MNSLQELLSEEGFQHSKFLKSRKQVNLRDEPIEKLPNYICHGQKSLTKTDKACTRNGSSKFSSKRVSWDSERSNSKSLLKVDEPAIDEVAVRAVISILSGYIGRYVKDFSFLEMIRHKCNSCLGPMKTKDLDDGIFSRIEQGMQSIEKLVEDQGSMKEVRVKSLSNSIQLLSSVASLNSKKSRSGSTCGVPNSHISACAQLYLSIVYKLEKNDRTSARHLLQVFSDSPFLGRTHLLPDLWEHLFLPHLLHLKIWYHEEIEILSNSHYFDKEKRCNALNKAYNKSLDMGTIQFALYYREWVKLGGKAPPIPSVPLPSRPNYSLSRRISSDSYTSHSLIERNLYTAVFGTTPVHLSTQLNGQKGDSMDAWDVREENVCIEEDGYKNVKYVTDKMRTHKRSSTQDYINSKNESWLERPKSSEYLSFFFCQSVVSECLVKGNNVVRSNSIKHIQHTDLPLTDLSRAIHTVSSSDSLSECEIAIQMITKAWLDSHGNPLIEDALSKAPVIEGILEVLFASDDDEVLELGVSVLAEFVARNEANRLIILNSDPQLEIFLRLLKSSSLFLKAAVLLYQLKPKAKQMISIEWVALTLRVLEFGDQLQTLFTVRCRPQKAAMYLLDQLLTGFSEDRNLENASQAVSLGGLSLLLRTLEKGDIDERSKAAMLMCCCIRADGSCRNYLSENVNKTSLLELIALGIQMKSNQFAFALLVELLCLNRRTQIIIFLIELNHGWDGLNTMHIFLVYLQRASSEERPLIATILLQLDLLGDPFKSSLFREDAVEAIIEALDCGACNTKVQEESARALLMLGSHFLENGEATAEEWFSKEAGFHERSVDPFCNLNEEEKAREDWQRKVAIVLLNSGSKRFLASLSNSIANGIPNLAQACLFTVAWMNRVLLSSGDGTFRSLAHSASLQQMPESLNFDRISASVLPSGSLQYLIKSSECVSMLKTLETQLIEPLRNL